MSVTRSSPHGEDPRLMGVRSRLGDDALSGVIRTTDEDRPRHTPRLSLLDVLWGIFDLPMEVWEGIRSRWHDDVDGPFLDIFDRPGAFEALIMDLMSQHLGRPWVLTTEDEATLAGTLLVEWEITGQRAL